MPSALTHINLANNILNLNNNLEKYKFLVGTIKPDCIDFDDDKQYKRSHYIRENYVIDYLSYLNKKEIIEQYNYSYFMGYHLHLWFDQMNKSLNISNLIKSKIKNKEIINSVKQEISKIDLSTVEEINFSELRKVCDNEFSSDLVKKVDEIINQIENVKKINDNIYYLDSEKYLKYISNLAKEYIDQYL